MPRKNKATREDLQKALELGIESSNPFKKPIEKLSDLLHENRDSGSMFTPAHRTKR